MGKNTSQQKDKKKYYIDWDNVIVRNEMKKYCSRFTYWKLGEHETERENHTRGETLSTEEETVRAR